MEAIPEQSLSEDPRVRARVKSRVSASLEPSVLTSKPENPIHLAFSSHGDRDRAGTIKNNSPYTKEHRLRALGLRNVADAAWISLPGFPL